MLGNSPFYFHSFRNIVVAFTDLMNNIQTTKSDSDGNVVKTLTVPIAFSGRQKYLARLREDTVKNADLTPSPNIEMSLPRMSFDIPSIQPDPSRKRSSLNKQQRKINIDNVERYLSQLSSNPYNMTIELTAYTYSLDEMLQIMEQILPFFTPDFNLTIIDVPEMNIQKDVPITLTGVQPTDSFEGLLEDYRIIEWTFSFDVSMDFYPPVLDGEIIRVAISNIQEDETPPVEQKTTQSVDPIDANSTDDWSVDKVIEESS